MPVKFKMYSTNARKEQLLRNSTDSYQNAFTKNVSPTEIEEKKAREEQSLRVESKKKVRWVNKDMSKKVSKKGEQWGKRSNRLSDTEDLLSALQWLAVQRASRKKPGYADVVALWDPCDDELQYFCNFNFILFCLVIGSKIAISFSAHYPFLIVSCGPKNFNGNCIIFFEVNLPSLCSVITEERALKVITDKMMVKAFQP